MNELKFKDIHNLASRVPEYSDMKLNYASILDRMYAIDYSKGVCFSKTLPVSFSDHSCFYFYLSVDNMFVLGKSYWNLNCSVLKESGVKDAFKKLWDHFKSDKSKYTTILDWWEFHVKIKVKEFYIRICKFKNQIRYNLLTMLENRLRKLYEITHSTGTPKMEINYVKNKIENIRDDIAEGIKIRARVQDLQCQGKVSKYLISKQNDIRSRKLLTCLRNNEGSEITTFPAIQEYVMVFFMKSFIKVVRYHKNLKKFF